jgi:hypothetical protein
MLAACEDLEQSSWQQNVTAGIRRNRSASEWKSVEKPPTSLQKAWSFLQI